MTGVSRKARRRNGKRSMRTVIRAVFDKHGDRPNTETFYLLDKRLCSKQGACKYFGNTKKNIMQAISHVRSELRAQGQLPAAPAANPAVAAVPVAFSAQAEATIDGILSIIGGGGPAVVGQRTLKRTLALVEETRQMINNALQQREVPV